VELLINMLNPKYFINQGTWKDVIRDDKLLFKCPFCGLWYRALAYHTRQAHNITGKHLRQLMGLKADYQLITPEIKERHRETALRDDMGTQLKKAGKNTRYKKGCAGHIKWSAQAIHQLKTRRKHEIIV